jgi:hypothetical protein
MRVGPASLETTPQTTPATARREVPLERTTATRAEIRAALSRAEERLTGHAARGSLVDLATAQACLETGGGRSMYNFNFGGIKGTSPSGLTATAGTHEWEGGTRYRTQAHFRAYESLDEGAADFLSLLHRRYAPAVAAAERGDVDGFAHALKAGGYFTGPEGRYANDLRSLLGLPRRPDDATPDDATPAAPAGAATFSTAQELALLLDAVSASAARIAAPTPEDA